MECKTCANYLNNLDLLLSDDELNKHILNVKHISLLRDLLQLKVRKIADGRGSKINYNLAAFYKDKDIEWDNLDLLCENISLCFKVVQDPEAHLTELMDFLNISLATDKYDTLQSDLTFRLFSELINILYKEIFKYLVIQRLNKINLHNFLVNYLVKKRCAKVYVNLSVLKKYFSFLKLYEQVDLLNKIFESFKRVDELEVVSYLLNEIESDTIRNIIFHRDSVFMSKDFYDFLAEDCFVKGNTTLIKQAQFILNKIALHAVDNEAPIYIKVEEGSRQSWEDFFFLLQISREKQLHLVQPALNLLPSLQHLHEVWRATIYKILLNHVQNVITYSSAIFIFEKESTNFFLEYVLEDFLQGVNRNEYNEMSNKMFSNLQKYSEEFTPENCDCFMEKLMKSFWNPLVLWKLFANVVNDNFVISPKVYAAICDYLTKVPHVYIRNACKMLITNKVVKKEFGKKEKDKYSEYLPVILSESTIDMLKTIPHIEKYFLMFFNEHVANWDFDKFKKYIDIGLKLNIKFHKSLNLSNLQWGYIYLNCPKSFAKEAKTFVIDHLLNDEEIKYESEAVYADFIFLYLNNFKIITEDIYLAAQAKEALSTSQKSNYSLFVLFILAKYKSTNKHVDLIKVHKKIEELLFESNLSDIDGRFYLDFLELSIEYSDLNLNQLKYIFETQSDEILAKVFRYIKNINFYKEHSLDLLDFFIVEISKLRKSLFFKSAVSTFIKSIFNYETYGKIQVKSSNLISKVLKVLQELMETFNFICSHLTEQISNLMKNDNFKTDENAELLLPILMELSLQGIIVKKESRIEYYVVEEISEKFPLLEENNKANFNIRLAVLQILRGLINFNNHRYSIFFKTFTERYYKNFGKRYFPDSLVHFEKLRIVQMLLIFCPFCKLENHLRSQIQFCITSLTEEHHQNAVKQLLQFLLFESIDKLDEVTKLQEFRKLLKTNKNQLIIVPFIPVLHHLAAKNPNFRAEYLNIMLPYTMGANFKLRSYVQISLRLLLQKMKVNNSKELKDCIEIILADNEASISNALKIDKYFMELNDLCEYYAINTILVHIPQMNNINNIEWQGFKNCEFGEGFKVRNIKEIINGTASSTEDSCCDNNNKKYTLMQKKITPYQSSNEHDVVFSGLVIVATLLDKATNIGGLSRTCEIFGVKQLILHDKNIVKNKEFLSLSMSSESWVEFLEVKRDNLGDYLDNMRKAGYRIVGAEQTNSSIKLNHFVFPKNTVVVLGNEKEGIPANLFPFLDTTVEIPQLGFTRSLNAHVAGATFIWEYSKQHYGKNPLFQ